MSLTMYVIGLLLLVANAINGALAFKERDHKAAWAGGVIALFVFVMLVANRSL